jgi:hypothetical protein
LCATSHRRKRDLSPRQPLASQLSARSSSEFRKGPIDANESSHLLAAQADSIHRATPDADDAFPCVVTIVTIHRTAEQRNHQSKIPSSRSKKSLLSAGRELARFPWICAALKAANRCVLARFDTNSLLISLQAANFSERPVRSKLHAPPRSLSFFFNNLLCSGKRAILRRSGDQTSFAETGRDLKLRQHWGSLTQRLSSLKCNQGFIFGCSVGENPLGPECPFRRPPV